MKNIIITLLIFIGALVLIHVIRYIGIVFLKKTYAYSDTCRDKKYCMNRKIFIFEFILIFLMLINLVASLEILSDDDSILQHIVIVLMVIILMISEIPMIVDVNRMESFFYLNHEFVEFNLAFRGKPKDKVVIPI